MDWWMNAIIAVCGYLLGMAFAGSFLGRKWMGTVDVALHRLLKREVTTGKYLYWKHFCGISEMRQGAPQVLDAIAVAPSTGTVSASGAVLFGSGHGQLGPPVGCASPTTGSYHQRLAELHQGRVDIGWAIA